MSKKSQNLRFFWGDLEQTGRIYASSILTDYFGMVGVV